MINIKGPPLEIILIFESVNFDGILSALVDSLLLSQCAPSLYKYALLMLECRYEKLGEDPFFITIDFIWKFQIPRFLRAIF